MSSQPGDGHTGEGDAARQNLVAEIVAALDGRRLTCAESCTGGLLAQQLAKADGSSEWFPGGIIAYQSDTKFAVLEVTPGPVVTHRTAQQMAAGAARLF